MKFFPAFAMLAFATLTISEATAQIGLPIADSKILNGYVLDSAYESLSAACSDAQRAGKLVALTRQWLTQSSVTCLAGVAPLGGVIQPNRNQTATLPCPTSVALKTFDTSVGGAGSIKFSTGCATPLDIRMFGASTAASDNTPFFDAAYQAFSNLGSATLTLPQGVFSHTTDFTLKPGLELHLSCAQAGTIQADGTLRGGTNIRYGGADFWFNQKAEEVTRNVTIDNCGFSTVAPALGIFRIGSKSQNVDLALLRQGWTFNNMILAGYSGSRPGTLGGIFTEMNKFTWNNVLWMGFYQPWIMDRAAVFTVIGGQDTNNTLGSTITYKAGSGTGAVWGAGVSLYNYQFTGPIYGTGQYAFTVDQQNVNCFGCLYEPELAGAEAAIHITEHGRNFRDVGGWFSFIGGPGSPPYTMVWDSGTTELSFVGTSYTSGTTAAKPICIGVPGTCAGHGSAVSGSASSMTAVSAPLYLACLALARTDCAASGGSPPGYGPYMPFTGPTRVDVNSAGDGTRYFLLKNGSASDFVTAANACLPASDYMTSGKCTSIGLRAHTESAGAGTNSSGWIFTTGNETATRTAMQLFADGHVAIPDGNLTLGLGKPYECTHGANAVCGVATLASGSATVSTTAIGALATTGTAGYAVSLTPLSCSSCGTLYTGTVTAGKGFVIKSTNESDASAVYWEIRYIN